MLTLPFKNKYSITAPRVVSVFSSKVLTFFALNTVVVKARKSLTVQLYSQTPSPYESKLGLLESLTSKRFIIFAEKMESDLI